MSRSKLYARTMAAPMTDEQIRWMNDVAEETGCNVADVIRCCVDTCRRNRNSKRSVASCLARVLLQSRLAGHSVVVDEGGVTFDGVRFDLEGSSAARLLDETRSLASLVPLHQHAHEEADGD